jgi:hypothetical protein
VGKICDVPSYKYGAGSLLFCNNPFLWGAAQLLPGFSIRRHGITSGSSSLLFYSINPHYLGVRSLFATYRFWIADSGFWIEKQIQNHKPVNHLTAESPWPQRNPLKQKAFRETHWLKL